MGASNGPPTCQGPRRRSISATMAASRTAVDLVRQVAQERRGERPGRRVGRAHADAGDRDPGKGGRQQGVQLVLVRQGERRTGEGRGLVAQVVAQHVAQGQEEGQSAMWAQHITTSRPPAAVTRRISRIAAERSAANCRPWWLSTSRKDPSMKGRSTMSARTQAAGSGRCSSRRPSSARWGRCPRRRPGPWGRSGRRPCRRRCRCRRPGPARTPPDGGAPRRSGAGWRVRR